MSRFAGEAEALALDEAARIRVVTDLSGNLLVEAGAGSGKTTIMVARIITGLAWGRFAIHEVAAITFLRKAAAEMRERLRASLEWILQRNGAVMDEDIQSPRTAALAQAWRWCLDHRPEALAPQDLIANLSRAREGVESASITTIDAFCLNVLRSFPVEAQVRPTLEILDEESPRSPLRTLWKSWWRTVMDHPPAHLEKPVRELAGRWREQPELEFNPDDIFRAAGIITQNFDLTPQRNDAPDLEWDIPIANVRDVLAKALEIAAKCNNPGDKLYQHYAGFFAWARSWLAKAHDQQLQDVMEQGPILERLVRSPGNQGSARNWDGDIKELRNELRRLTAEQSDNHPELWLAVYNPLNNHLHRQAMELALDFARAAHELRFSRGVFAFSDILLIVRDLLVRNRVVRKRLHDRYKTLMVDEFQDTDPVQAEIAWLLTSDPETSPGSGYPGPAWKSLRPLPGRLFLVGDPKQSIYRFRRADTALYNEVRGIAAAGQALSLVELTRNFRSRAGVIHLVNRIFEQEMAPAANPSGSQAPFAALTPTRDNQHGCVIELQYGHGREFGAVAKVREYEAEQVVRWIAARLNQAADPREEAGRICLLFRSKGDAWDEYEHALRSTGIPFVVEGGHGVLPRAEVLGLLSLLRALEHPEDQMALAAALRSPLLCVSDEELLAHRGNGGSWRLLDVSNDRVPGRAAAWICKLRVLRTQVLRADRAGALMRQWLGAEGVLPAIQLQPQGDQRCANLLMILSRVDDLMARESVTFRGAVRYLRAQYDSEAELNEPILPVGGGFVRMMTIHKSKGLEFGAVVMCDAMYAGAPRYIRDTTPRGGGKIYLRIDKLEPPGWKEAIAREKQMEREELIRLKYVMATRARDELVIPSFKGHMERRENTPGFLAPFLTAIEEGHCPEALRIHLNDLPPSAPPAPPPWEELTAPDPAPLEAMSREIRRRETIIARASAPSFAIVRPSYVEEGISGGDDEDPVSPAEEAEFIRRKREETFLREDAARFGDLCHGLLEAFAACPALVEDRGRVGRLAIASGFRPDELDRAFALCVRAWRHPELILARQGLWHAEYPVAAWLDGVLVEGQADLAWRGAGGWRIVDFKTGHAGAGAEELFQAYGGQLGAYLTALEMMSGEAVEAVGLFKLESGDLFWRVADDQLRARARESLRAAAGAAR
ncbi:MAG: ATP-dependent helicase/nuclease subunit A [Myxococcota bacterium]|nr:ATP-dependent helicase/nuclease subunit A [Myxococcota bacterium]